MKARFVYILAFLFICMTATSASPCHAVYSFYPLSLDEGLSQTTIRSMLMDTEGIFWVGTKKGVNAFRLNRIANYTYNHNDSLSLADNQINFIAEDSLHNIWVGSNNGLALLNRKVDKFERRFPRGTFSAYATRQYTYFGASNQLLRYNNATRRLETAVTIVPQAEHNRNFRIMDIRPLPNGKLMLGTKEKGIFIYNPHNESIQPFIDDELHFLESICLTSDSCIYVATSGNGVYQYTPDGNLIHHYTIQSGDIATNYILDLYERNGELWICTDGKGIHILNLTTRHSRTLEHIPGDPFSLPTNSITSIYSAPNGLLWVGSVRRGAFCIKESFIRTYREAPEGNPYGLTEATVISFCKESDDLMWIGTDGGGVNLFNAATSQFKHFPTTYGDKIFAITQYSDRELLLSIYTKGMFLFNKTTGQCRPFYIVDKETSYRETFFGNFPIVHHVAPDKIYIFGTHPWIYTPSTHTFRKMRTTHNGSIQFEALDLAYYNSTFSLLMYKNEVFYVDQLTDQAAPLFKLDSQAHITSLAFDNNHTIWVGSNMGLGRYDMNTGQYTPVTTRLFNNSTFVSFDGKDHLWIGAQANLFSYSIIENKFTHYNRSDGFIPNEILFTGRDSQRKDILYLGGNNGLVQINNTVPQKRTDAPQIALSDIFLNGESVMSQTSGATIEIPHNYNSLVLSIQIMSNDVFQRNLIKYTIEKDGQPIELETYNTRISLPSSLTPGVYHIKAACFAKTGDLPPLVKLASIMVRPPWYATNWFIFANLVVLVLIFFTIAYISYRTKAKKIRRNMYRYKQHVNEDKINFLININHELRTPLTLIYAPLKRIIERGKDNPNYAATYTQLQLIYKQARRMYSIINMVLDLNRVEAGYKEMKMAAHPLNEWLGDMVRDFQSEADEKQITFSCQFDPQIGDLWFDEWKCQIILSNILMNAIKFTSPQTVVTLTTQVRPDGFVRISVTDQGIGLTDDDLKHVFERHYEGNHTEKGSGIGLSYSRMLAEIHGGRMGCYNNPDQGATFYFELPLNEEKAPSVRKEDHLVQADNLKLKDTEISINLKDYSILIVEDTDDLRKYLYDAFKEIFREVYTANNGQSALKCCYTQDPDIVVSDVTMPVMDGFELCSRIKSDQRFSHILVILLTAHSKKEDEKLGYKLGADFYVKKPFDMEFLQTVLTSMLSRRQQYIKEQFADFLPSPQDVTTSTGDEQFLCKLNDIINENISNEDLNITFICEQIGMGRTSLYKKMSKVTGMGVNDYINRIRIEKSEHYLLHTELSIKEISQELGFAYPRYFSTTFKQFKGLTPTQFKEQNKK